MKPIEIQQLIQQSPALRDAIKAEKAVWDFFRQRVHLPANQEEAWIILVCRNCLNKDEDAKETYPLLQHPYDHRNEGWCADCVLQAFQADAPFWQPPEPEYDPMPRYYSSEWGEIHAITGWLEIPGDYDGYNAIG